jgi:hypothetical protein
LERAAAGRQPDWQAVAVITLMTFDLELARQHVSRSKRLVADQIELIQRMKRLGWETNEPEQTLELFEQRLLAFEEYLRILEGAQSGETAPAG